MTARLVYDDSFESYRFGSDHPLRPERFALTAALIGRWGLAAAPSFDAAARIRPTDDDTIALAHSRELIEAVRSASIDPSRADARFGIGPGDTPAFFGMHEAAALSVASTCHAMDLVLGGTATRAFSPAGGMHHAHRDRCAGFCVYNDCAVAIERAVRRHAGLRVAYVDIDAHHGDGVQEAFYERPDVLTISIHETGRYLYPGTGFAGDVGEGDGYGYAINVPLPPGAGRDQYLAAIDHVVAPALASFAPDLLVLQLGADSHHSDPLTQLGQTVPGFVEAVGRLIEISDSTASGRLVATGGGGYTPFDATPRMWASAFARMCDVEVPERLPDAWLAEVERAASGAGPASPTTLDDFFALDDASTAQVADLTARAIEQVRAASPLLG